MSFLRIFLVVMLFSVYGCDNTTVTMETSPVNAENKNFSGAKTVAESQDGFEPEEVIANANGFMPFYVYTDCGSQKNHYTPSGFMGDWKCLKFDDNWKGNCQEGETCIKIEYDLQCSRGNQRWAGIYWLNPPNNWGKRKGGYNLTGAEKLVFWARGEVGGEQIQEFRIGGIGSTYPDSDTAVIGPIVLSSVWKKYSIDLAGKDLSYISGGLAWTTSEDVNSESCTFFLDNIRFE